MKSKQYQVALLLHTALVANAPKDTWNLALNGIRIIQENGKFYVAIGGEPAPYAFFTNEKWEQGKNPNEGWIDRTIEQCLPHIRQIMSGDLTVEDVNRIIEERYRKSILKQQADFLARKGNEYANIREYIQTQFERKTKKVS